MSSISEKVPNPDEVLGLKENDILLANQGMDKDLPALSSDVKAFLESRDTKEYALLGPEDSLGKELLTVYREHGIESLKKAYSLLTSSGTLKEADKETALKLLKEEKGKNLQLRSVAADKLMGQVGSFRDEGILITRRTDKKGHVKIELFHIAGLSDAFGEGRFSKVYKVREEVFGTTYKDKIAAFKTSMEPGLQSDILSLEWIKELNGGRMPEGIQKFPKMYGPEGQVLKFYGHKDLIEIVNAGVFENVDVIKSFRGPLKALAFFKQFGVAHTDIKPDNIIFAEGAEEGVTADFGKVYIFPPLNFEDREDVQKKAKRMLKIIGSERPVKIHVTPKFQTEADYSYYLKILNEQIVPGLERIAGGFEPGEKFLENYEEMRYRIEKMQVMQLGITLAFALIGADFFSCVVPEQNFEEQNFVTHLNSDLLQTLLFEELGENEFSIPLLKLLWGMLLPDHKRRPKAEQVQSYYESLLKKFDL